jgi:hypothetical protein
MFLENTYRKPVLDLLEEKLGLGPELLDDLYAHFKQAAESKSSIDQEGTHRFPIEELKDQDLKNEALGKCSYGIDLPVWFSAPTENRKKIFLLAIDPLRRPDDRTTANFNSPFSIHMDENNNYVAAIKSLSEKYDLYITDIYKLFFREKSNPAVVSKSIGTFQTLEIHAELIEQEIDLFKPDFILCMGRAPLDGLHTLGRLSPEPQSVVQKLVPYTFRTANGHIPTYAIPHASGLAAGWAAKFMGNWNRPYHNKTYLADAVDIILGEHQL